MTQKNSVNDFWPVSLDQIEILVKGLRGKGLHEEADAMELLLGAWCRTTEAYRYGAPFIPKEHRSNLHVVDYTIRTWGTKLVGTSLPNDSEVLSEVAADEEWHRMNNS